MSLYVSSAYTSFRYSESQAPAHRGPQNRWLPKASMAELLVTKQDPNSCDWVGKSPTNLEAMSLNYYTKILFWTLYPNSCSGLEVKHGLKSNSIRSGQPTYEACDDNLDAWI